MPITLTQDNISHFIKEAGKALRSNDKCEYREIRTLKQILEDRKLRLPIR